MNKIKSHYNLRKFDLPESFNQSDVMIEVQYNKISKAEYYKLKKTDALVKVIVTENIRTYKDEYNYILNSKIKDKEKALKNLYNDFYNLADEYITELEKYKSFLSEDYLNRVKSNLKPTMEHYITKILNAKNVDKW